MFVVGIYVAPLLRPSPEEVAAAVAAAEKEEVETITNAAIELVGHQLVYVRDERNGICFAAGRSIEVIERLVGKTHSLKPVEVVTVFTTVNCEEVAAYLVQ